jgi:hypothetical protein
MDARMTGRMKYGDYIRKLARIWASHSYRRRKRWQARIGAGSVCLSSIFRNSDWLQLFAACVSLQSFQLPSKLNLVTLKMEAERYFETLIHLYLKEHKRDLQMGFTSSSLSLTSVYNVHSSDLTHSYLVYWMRSIVVLLNLCTHLLYLMLTFEWWSLPLWVRDFRMQILVWWLCFMTEDFLRSVHSNKRWNTAIRTGNHRFLPKSFAVHKYAALICCSWKCVI